MAISFKHTAQELNRGIVEVQFQGWTPISQGSSNWDCGLKNCRVNP